MKNIVKIISLTFLLSLTYQAQSTPSILSSWSDYYPNSTSDDRSCQLCHVDENFPVTYNAYGADLESAFDFFGFFGLEDSFADIESSNSDEDEAGLTNLEEIEMGLDPGWTIGFTNEVRPGVTSDAAPPFVDIDGGFDGDIKICFPVKVVGSELDTICLNDE